MFNSKVLSGLFLLMVTFSCKPGEDPLLKEALSIQDEAIHIGMDLDKMISEVMVSDTSRENLLFTGSMKAKYVQWKKQMIVVPGMQHDHDHGDNVDHDHDGHDHAGHDHADHDNLQSSGKEIGLHLSPAELKDVQVEWKNEIVNLKAEFEKYKQEKGK